MNQSSVRTSWLILVAFLVLTACATTSGVAPMGPDTFTVTGRSEFGSHKAKHAALEEANKYAAERGLYMIPVSVEASSESDFMGDRIYTYDLVFRLVDESDPEYQRTNLKEAPDIVIRDERKSESAKPSRYDRLRELKALLDEGVLTQEEFDAEKLKILNDD